MSWEKLCITSSVYYFKLNGQFSQILIFKSKPKSQKAIRQCCIIKMVNIFLVVLKKLTMVPPLLTSSLFDVTCSIFPWYADITGKRALSPITRSTNIWLYDLRPQGSCLSSKDLIRNDWGWMSPSLALHSSIHSQYGSSMVEKHRI